MQGRIRIRPNQHEDYKLQVDLQSRLEGRIGHIFGDILGKA